MTEVKLYFAPLPPRAIADDRLSGLDLRVLACIALHDRMSGKLKKGQGCTAGNRTLATEIGCDYSRLSACITKLGTLGYVEKTAHPLNRRQRVYRVIYTDDDSSFVKGESLPPRKQKPDIVCQDFEDVQPDQGLTDVNIFRETEKIFRRNGERNSPEGARPFGLAMPAKVGNGNEGSAIAQFERVWKQGERNPEWVAAWLEYLEAVHADGAMGDPNAERAGRLCGDLYAWLEDREADA